MDGITDADYKHVKRDDFRIHTQGQYHDLYVQSYTLLQVDVLESLRNECIEIHELDQAPQTDMRVLPKKRVELESLTDLDILLMLQKGIKGRKCHAIHIYAKATNKYMKDYDPSKESSLITYWDVRNLEM